MRREVMRAAAIAALSLWAPAALDAAPPAGARDPAPTQGPVSREEYDKLLAEQRAMRAEMDQLKRERAAGAPSNSAPSATAPAIQVQEKPATQQDLDDVQKQVEALRQDVSRSRPGFEEFLFAGDAAVGFTSQRKGNSSFSAGFSPLMLWKPSDRLLFEAALDVNLSTNPDASSSTSVDLKIADASYVVNDWLIVGGGLFVTPFGVYHNHFDPPWINKLPDDPLPFGDRAIAPGSAVGFFARGAFPVRTSKLTYDVYVSNGPNVITSDPAAAGSLSFDNFSDLNNNKAVGGRVGFLPTPNVEVGYSIMAGKAQPGGFPTTRVLLQAADLSWRQEVQPLWGTFDLRTEWAWSDVGRQTYDPTASLGFGPLSFSNYRDGGYVQFAYRPNLVHNPVLRNFEFVSRWDIVRIPQSAPGGGNEQRYTVGIDYWLSPQAVLKIAYQWDIRDRVVGPDQNAIMFQLGLGL